MWTGDADMRIGKGLLSMRQLYPRRRTETLDYIQAMLGQLRTMSEAERCDMLSYLIEMAYLEASASLGQAYNDARAGSETPT